LQNSHLQLQPVAETTVADESVLRMRTVLCNAISDLFDGLTY